MGIDTNYELKKQPFNISWKRYVEFRHITIPKNRRFGADTKFFAIGSCFANELRDSLERNGFDAHPKPSPTIFGDCPDEIKKSSSWGAWDDRVHLQFYNTESIRQEFEKAFGEWTQRDDDYFKVTQSGVHQYWDPYRRSIYAHTPDGFARILRAQDAAMRHGIMTADVAVITLGLIEVFRRKKATKLNGFFAGSRRMVTCQNNKHFSKQVKFETLGFAENYANVKKVCDLFFNAFPKKHLIVTVSPIALTQTFRDLDVVVANTESKSVLRAVAGQISREYKNVIYWPSYEICLNNQNSFKDDLRHVTRSRVDSIMGSFIHCNMNIPRTEEQEQLRYFD